jgi:hypothetical protein
MAERAAEAVNRIEEAIKQNNAGKVPFQMSLMLRAMRDGLPVLFAFHPGEAKKYCEMIFEMLSYVLGYSDRME